MSDFDNDPALGSSLEEFLRTLIQRRAKLAERREQLQTKAESVLLVAREQGRDVLETEEDAEVQRYMSEMRGLGKDIEALDERVTEVGEEVRRSGQINAGLKKIRSTEKSVLSIKEQSTYIKGDPRRSYMQDLIRMSMNLDTTGEARERLMRHAQDVRTQPEYRTSPGGYTDLSRVEGEGGYAVPPAWLMEQYVELARPGRAFANLVQRQPLPGGTDSINIPKLLTGTDVDVQREDNLDIADVPLSDTFINAPVRTVAGAQGVAIQLIDQSPIAFDDVVFRDLTAAHASRLNQQVISGTGVNGQVLGTSGTAGIGSLPVTGALTIQSVYSAIANAVQTVHTTRYLPPEVIVMHPRRWGWFLSLLDTTDRPLFLPGANNGMNLAGVLSDVASQQVVGQMHGLPVVTDPGIPTNVNGTEDVIYVLRASDLVLWESGIRARVLPETKAQSLTVLLQIYSYIAFSAARYPQSVVEVSGLEAPSW